MLKHTQNSEAKQLGKQVEDWYQTGIHKRDIIVAKLRAIKQDELADEIHRWYVGGSVGFRRILQNIRKL